jgi:hypothetical protein
MSDDGNDNDDEQEDNNNVLNKVQHYSGLNMLDPAIA